MTGHGRSAPGARPRAGRSDPGQATVETALIVPVVVLLALAIGQVALVAHARVSVSHAAREGARAAAVGESDRAVRSAVLAAASLSPSRLGVEVRHRGSNVEVTVRYTDPTDVAIVGPLLGEVTIVAVAVMRRE